MLRPVDHETSDTPRPTDTPPDASPAKPAGAGRRGLGCAIEIVETLVLTLVIFFVVQTFVAQPFQVQQHSMERTFEEGDYVLVDRLSHLWSPYTHGQVVVFQAPATTGLTEPLIKRIIGVAGDTVEVRDGKVYVNGVAIDEPYLYKDSTGTAQPTTAGIDSRWLVPAGDLFVMGDHRQVSEDSRVFGPIPVSTVIGRGVIRYWPIAKIGIVATPTYDAVSAP